ncbi:MAG: hypothetical protein GY909_01835 [Oligoflexia bacterium]|nr:hypothetical protein [Oligoflexia bacterium]
MEDSVYLHSKDSEQVKAQYFEQTSFSDCPYSRNLTAMMESENVSDFYGQHLVECQVCQQKALNWKKQMDELRQMIPTYSMPESQRPRFERGLKKIDKMIKKRSQKLIKERVFQFKNSSVNVLVDFFSIFIKREFFIGIIWALIAFAAASLII